MGRLMQQTARNRQGDASTNPNVQRMQQQQSENLRTGCYTTFVYIVTISLALSEYFYSFYSNYLTCTFQYLVMHYQVWRFLTTGFCDPNLFVMFFIWLTADTFFTRFERKNASVVLFYELIALSLSVQIFLIPAQGIYYIMQRYYYQIIDPQLAYYSFPVGMGAIWINFVYKFCYYLSKDSQATRKTIRLISSLQQTEITSHFLVLPFIFLIVSHFLCWKIRIDMIFGLLLAMFECWCQKGGMLKYTMGTYTDRQYTAEVICLNSYSNYVPFVSSDYEENNYMAVEPYQFYQNVAHKVVQRHHRVHSLAGYERTSQDFQSTNLKDQITRLDDPIE